MSLPQPDRKMTRASAAWRAATARRYSMLIWGLVIATAILVSGCDQSKETDHQEAVARALDTLIRQRQSPPPENKVPTPPSQAEMLRALNGPENCQQDGSAKVRIYWGDTGVPAAETRYRLKDASGNILAEGTTSECGDTTLDASRAPADMTVKIGQPRVSDDGAAN